MEIGAYDYDRELLEEAKHKKQSYTLYPFPRTAVVCGPSVEPAGELHLDNVKKDGVPVLKRKGGGCPVVLDEGNLIFSVARKASGTGKLKHFFNMFLKCLVDALRMSGLPGANERGISDIAIGDKKIAGSCIYRSRGLVYFSASILVDPDLSLIEKYLKHPPREPDYRKGRSHRDFVASLTDIRKKFDEKRFKGTLQKKLRQLLN